MCAYEPLRKRILVIDDDIDLLMLLERSLQKHGYEVETAASLPAGEELLSYFDPHLVLLDINVRGSDGRQLCWKLKHKPVYRVPKVLMISGFDYSPSRANLFGADGILPKPFPTQILLSRVSELTSGFIENG